MMDEKDKFELSKLILELTEGTISSEQMEHLDQMLCQSPEALDFYRDFMKNVIVLKRISVLQNRGEELLKSDLWQALAQQEKTAPAVEIPPKEIEEPIQEIGRQSVQIKINRGSLITLLLSMAAVLLFVLIVRFVPSKTGIEVATLTDSIRAKWADADTSMARGTRLVTGSTGYLLREGIAQIEFDNHAKVTIESPAEFEIVTGDQIKLNYGRLYAAVPQSAIGFAVGTTSVRIIDLGTEFGVKADSEAVTELHVIKGKTSCITGKKDRKCSEVCEGFAKLITGEQGIVKDIPCRRDMFIREINSDKKYVWRGQNLDVANLVAGGNGISDQPYFKRIDPMTGKYSTSTQLEEPKDSVVSNDFRAVYPSGVIDGIAVPSGRTIVSSQGQSFECLKTSQNFSRDIIAFNDGHNLSENRYMGPVFYHGRKCGDKDFPALLLHSNVLITLDLQKVRDILPQNTLKSFRAAGGITEAVIGKPDKGKVDFYVLIDGKPRYQKTSLTTDDGMVNIDIPITGEDRFLTFIVTEGQEDLKYLPWSNDFFYLIKPELVF
jgi:hypothetical protein